jgi:ATP-binding cassette, subfamily F, member 3
MIELKGLSLSRGQKPLLEGASLTIYPGDKVGLVGSNGCGKSSLFSLIKGELKEDLGDFFLPKSWRISYVTQDVEQTTLSALDYVLQGDDAYYQLIEKIQEAETTHDGHLLADLHEQLAAIDGYTAPSRAAVLLYGLGFSIEQQQMAVQDFSGGWQMRLNLARALMKPCELLLLDEPTNHLDLDAIVWLEAWLTSFQGTMILIAHDSAFLDATVDKIIWFHDKKLNVYQGNYQSFLERRSMQLALAQKAFEEQQKKRAHLQSFINRFKAKASKAKQAQSRVKQLAKMEVLAAVQIDSPFSFELNSSSGCPNPVLQLKNAQLGYPNKTIINKCHLSLGPEDRIGLLGVNGAGKSTLMKTLAGDLPLLEGELVKSPRLQIGYFAQHQVDLLDMEETPYWHLHQLARGLSPQEIRGFLGKFGFSGDHAFVLVQDLSGGEKARLVLALIAYQKPHLLLLDEPTNHLDLEMREALTLAINEFEGAVVLVSHDRQLLGSVADTFWLVDDGKVQNYDEDLEAYVQYLLAKKQQNVVKSISGKKVTAQDHRAQQQQLNKIEDKIEKSNKELQKINTQLDDQKLYADEKGHLKVNELLNKKKILEEQIKELELEWYKFAN